jgi:hypothetical protein
MKPPTKKSKATTRYLLQPLLAVPIKSGVQKLNKLIEFYLYCAPQIDSAHSCGKLKETIHDKVFQDILNAADMRSGKSMKMLTRITDSSFSSLELDGPELSFNPPRMVCKKSYTKTTTETDLAALLRHIRNSFAHGGLYVKKTKKGNHLCLEDFDSKKKGLTARIVITDKILTSWKNIIDGYCCSENMI